MPLPTVRIPPPKQNRLRKRIPTTLVFRAPTGGSQDTIRRLIADGFAKLIATQITVNQAKRDTKLRIETKTHAN